MKINQKDKKEFRNKIAELLMKVPAGERIKLDKNLLEELLFDEIVVNKEKGLIAKLPIWSGEFLRRLDLSEVSFENVSWNVLGMYYDDIEFDGIVIDKGFEEQIRKFQGENRDYIADYSYTNANIDLTRSFEAINCGEITIRCCNFKGLNFKSQDLSSIKSLFICDSDISNTGLIIPPTIELFASNGDFSNIDLSSFTIDGNECIDGYVFENCCLANSGIKIEFDASKYKEDIDNFSRTVGVARGDGSNFYIDAIRKAFNKNWVGCYLNGKKIYSSKEKQAMAQEKRAEYEKMKEELISYATNAIEQQSSGFGRK